MLCPTEATNAPATSSNGTSATADRTPRSYLINGWNDHYADILSPAEFGQYMAGNYTNGLKESVITHPTDTVVLGEKRAETGDYHMDLLEGTGKDFSGVAELSRHSGQGASTKSGGVIHPFADGSARYLRFPRSLNPLNLWAISDANRIKYQVIFN